MLWFLVVKISTFYHPDWLLGHPTYLSVDLGFTVILLLSSSFFHQLPFELAERNSTKTGHMLANKCGLKNTCPKTEVYLPPTNRGLKNHLFRQVCNLIATLTTYIFGMKHHTHKRASALETTKGLLHRLKMS